jgi:hypothetical protein
MNPKLPKVRRVYMPRELWLEIFEFCSVASLLNARSVNKAWNVLANDILAARLKNELLEVCVLSRNQEIDYKAIKQNCEAELGHYRDFLNVPGTVENLSEVISYINVQHEVQMVCECLVRLRGGVATPYTERMTWKDIRTRMKKSDFKIWLYNLSINVEFIDLEDIHKVENMIRFDVTITYERLRDISLAGYRLLILVAACIQFSIVSNRLSEKKVKTEALQRKLVNASKFMDVITLKL